MYLIKNYRKETQKNGPLIVGSQALWYLDVMGNGKGPLIIALNNDYVDHCHSTFSFLASVRTKSLQKQDGK